MSIRAPRPARRLALLCIALTLSATAAAAQVREVRITSDNDAYDFWVPVATRPDREYSNGIELSMDVAGGPVWARRLAPHVAACTGAEDAAATCAGTTVDFGQKIFTPRSDGVVPQPGQRAYAGWLYLAGTAQLQTASRRRSLGVEVGVTGPPSLGRSVHMAWHRALGLWTPEGWDNQVRFEPGVVLRYDERRLLADARAGGVRVATLQAEGGAALGNVLTEAHGGVRARLGWRVPHPWSAAADRGAEGASAYLLAGVRGRAVAHNLFLDGNTFSNEAPRVEHRPLVGEAEVGAGFRLGRVAAEYRVVSRGREYQTEPGGHQYGTIALTYRLR
jgi:lipid A 3-O-deacylase